MTVFAAMLRINGIFITFELNIRPLNLKRHNHEENVPGFSVPDIY